MAVCVVGLDKRLKGNHTHNEKVIQSYRRFISRCCELVKSHSSDFPKFSCRLSGSLLPIGCSKTKVFPKEVAWLTQRVRTFLGAGMGWNDPRVLIKQHGLICSSIISQSARSILDQMKGNPLNQRVINKAKHKEKKKKILLVCFLYNTCFIWCNNISNFISVVA